MLDEDIKELYQELVKEHSKKPRNYGVLHCGCHAKGKNPACGDEVTLYVDINNEKIDDVKFTGQGCALCLSSSSLLTQAIKGKSVDDVKILTQNFIEFINENKALSEEYEPLHIFQGVHQFPLRVKCVLLAWRTLENILNNKGISNE